LLFGGNLIISSQRDDDNGLCFAWFDLGLRFFLFSCKLLSRDYISDDSMK
jgi:hypothetical protein